MELSLLEELKERLNLDSVDRRVFAGVAAIIVTVAVIVGCHLAGAAAASEFRVASASAEEAPSSAAPPAPSSLYVHVSGEVRQPGLCEVESGARVAAAIEAAGGFTDDAATDSVNLAREVSDGEQIVVAKRQTEEEAAAAAQTGAPSALGAGSSSGLVNINTASEAELKSLPGIGDAIAAKIVADRQANGAFKTVEDLKRVQGVGDRKYELLSGLICV